jgi:hypothetical protein
MPFFKVKKDCEFRRMVAGTNVTRELFIEGDVVELSDINDGEQPGRLDPMSDEETKKYLDKKAREQAEEQKRIEAGKPKEQATTANQSNDSSKGGNGGNQNLQNAKNALRG